MSGGVRGRSVRVTARPPTASAAACLINDESSCRPHRFHTSPSQHPPRWNRCCCLACTCAHPAASQLKSSRSSEQQCRCSNAFVFHQIRARRAASASSAGRAGGASCQRRLRSTRASAPRSSPPSASPSTWPSRGRRCGGPERARARGHAHAHRGMRTRARTATPACTGHTAHMVHTVFMGAHSHAPRTHTRTHPTHLTHPGHGHPGLPAGQGRATATAQGRTSGCARGCAQVEGAGQDACGVATWMHCVRACGLLPQPCAPSTPPARPRPLAHPRPSPPLHRARRCARPWPRSARCLLPSPLASRCRRRRRARRTRPSSNVGCVPQSCGALLARRAVRGEGGALDAVCR